MGRITQKEKEIVFDDGPIIDAGGRLRTAFPVQTYVSQLTYDTNLTWAEDINGVGASVTYLHEEASARMDIGTADGEYVIRQTYENFHYVPGKSQLITMTGILGEQKPNVISRIGQFDDENGLFFQADGSGLSVVRRTFTSGSVINNQVYRSSWNIDKMDGSGPSRINLDTTKVQLFFIDYLWQGVGRIRFGFNIDGVNYYCHQMVTANIATEVYMSRAILPLRYEIRNVGVSGSSSSMKQICCSIVSEGGNQLPGREYSTSNGITLRAVTTRTPILAIRMLPTLKGYPNLKHVNLLSTRSITNGADAFFETAHVFEPSVVVGTWNPVLLNDSCIEVSTDITSVTAQAQHIIDSWYVPANQGSFSGTGSSVVDLISDHTKLTLNPFTQVSNMFVIYATSLSGSADVGATMDWLEYE